MAKRNPLRTQPKCADVANNFLAMARLARRLGVVAFEVEGVHPHDVGQVLDFEDVAIRVGHHCAIPLHRFFGVKASSRVTVALTTTAEEIEQFIEGLHKVQKYFGGASERA